MPLLVAANAWTEILRAPEKDTVVSKNAIVSEERALFSEHIGEKSHIFSSLNTSSRTVFKCTGNNFVLDLFLSDGRKSEREWERAREGEGDIVGRSYHAVLWSYRLTPMM